MPEDRLPSSILYGGPNRYPAATPSGEYSRICVVMAGVSKVSAQN